MDDSLITFILNNRILVYFLLQWFTVVREKTRGHQNENHDFPEYLAVRSVEVSPLGK